MGGLPSARNHNCGAPNCGPILEQVERVSGSGTPEKCAGMIGRAIRASNPHCRIFICNMLPEVYEAPVLKQRATRFNELLFRAVVGINTKLGRTFFLAIHEQFMDSQLRVIKPTQQCFQDSQRLTRLGCILFRACIQREVSVTPYHLQEKK